MIEIAFTESAHGGLQIAQTYGKGKYRGGPVGVFIRHKDSSEPTREEIAEARRKAEEQELRNWESAVPLGGSSRDVFGFSMGLSFGDIREPVISENRIEALKILYAVWNEILDNQERQKMKRVETDLAIIRERLEAGEDMRIWYSDTPDELCGLYWLMDQLRNLQETHGSIYGVKLPEFVENGDSIISYTGWGEVEPGHFGSFMHLAKPVSDQLRRYYANRWKQLQQENSMIRACVNGRLVSAPENLYDLYIQREIDIQCDEFMEAIVVGNVLGKYQPGISDGYIHFRIEKMIDSGKLAAVTEPSEESPGYHRLLKKV